MIFPRGVKTSEFGVWVATTLITVLGELLSYYLNNPTIAHAALPVALLAGVYIASRTVLKGLAPGALSAAPAASVATDPAPMDAATFFEAVRAARAAQQTNPPPKPATTEVPNTPPIPDGAPVPLPYYPTLNTFIAPIPTATAGVNLPTTDYPGLSVYTGTATTAKFTPPVDIAATANLQPNTQTATTALGTMSSIYPPHG